MAVIKFNTKKNDPAVTFEELAILISKLSNGSGPEAYNPLFYGLAISKFDNIQLEKLLVLMSQQLKCSLKIIRKEYKDFKQNHQKTTDFGLLMARKTLSGFYGSGAFLKRNMDGTYFFFDKTHWRVTSPDTIRRNIQELINQQPAVPDKSTSALVREAMQCLDDMLASDDDMLEIEQGSQTLINCKNLEVILDDSQFVNTRPHQPLSWNFSCLEYDYDPTATCPKFDQTILEIFSKSTNPTDMVRHMEELFGYALSGRRNIAMFILMVGHGRNGKSKILETLQRLMGPSSVLSDSLATFQKDRFNMAALHGKLLFCDDDLNHGTILNDGLIKKISESKQLSARHPYGKRKFTFFNKALPVIASNDYPSSDDISPGMIRRANVIPFDRQFTEDEDDQSLFPAIWENEMSGILNRALQGLKRLNGRGGFLLPDDCKRANKEFLAHANPLYAFLADCCEIIPDTKMFVKDFRELYAVWAKEQGITINKEDKKLFRKLAALQNEFGFKVTKDPSKVAYPLIYSLCVKDHFI